MKKIFLFVSSLLISTSIVGCNNNAEDKNEYECEHKCVICGLCDDVSCSDENCKNKCQGHISSGFEGEVDGVHFKLYDLGVVSTHTEMQERYLKDSNPDALFTDAYFGSTYKCNKNNADPAKIELQFDVTNAFVNKKQIYVSETPDFENAKVYETSNDYCNITNLKTGTKYYWYVKAGDVKSGIALFSTKAGGPRNIAIDGFQNIRDIGGWETTNGNVIRQGLLYRSAALNWGYSPATSLMITEKGIEQLRDELGIKTEIDLRGVYSDSQKIHEENGGLTSSIISEQVNYQYCGMKYRQSAESLLDNNKEQVAKVFHILADRDNYPILFHCQGGLDRTGMIAFFINALCGVSYENLIKDYLFSNFAKTDDPRYVLNFNNENYYNIIKKANGNSLVSKTYNTLVSKGVSSDDIDEVMNIMIVGFDADI